MRPRDSDEPAPDTDEVDRSLTEVYRAESVVERLRAASRHAATLERLRRAASCVLRALQDAGVAQIVGGAAAVIHGAPTSTQELDIVPRRRVTSRGCSRC